MSDLWGRGHGASLRPVAHLDLSARIVAHVGPRVKAHGVSWVECMPTGYPGPRVRPMGHLGPSVRAVEYLGPSVRPVGLSMGPEGHLSP